MAYNIPVISHRLGMQIHLNLYFVLPQYEVKNNTVTP